MPAHVKLLLVVLLLLLLDLFYTSFGHLKIPPGRGGSKKNKFVDKLLSFSRDYNQLLHPLHDQGNQTLDVKFQLNLRNVLDVNEVAQTCSLETTVRMFWKDHRVRMRRYVHNINDSYVTINPSAAKYFWIPDVFIDQSKKLRAPTFYIRPASIRVYQDSTVRFAARVNFDVACKMSFHEYPNDVQVCEIKLESFGYTTEQMRYRWIQGNNVNRNISLPQFDFEVTFGDNYATDYYELSYPGVIVRITFKRKMSFHIIQTYIPSAMFVALAWLTIFIPPDQIPGRVTVSMTTLLTLTAMFAAVRTNVPKVSYVSLLDVWMFVCIVFVFGVIVHFVIVIALLRHEHKMISKLVEYGGAMLIPILFATFNLFYWIRLASPNA